MAYRIGLVGSDNSHAITFSQIANGIDQINHVPGFKATHIFGLEEDRTKEVAEKGKIGKIVSDPNQMIGEIDIAFIEFRHGGLHLEYARPFIESGIPVFVDKPLASTVEEARGLVKMAVDGGIPFTSFSTLRFADAVQELRDIFSREEPIFMSASGPADVKSEYGGLIFYGIHLSEILNEVAGCGSMDVVARAKEKDIVATVMHRQLVADLKMAPVMPYIFAIQGLTKQSYFSKKVDMEGCYKKGMLKIKEMLDKRQWPLSGDAMIEPVMVIKAIEDCILSNTPSRQL